MAEIFFGYIFSLVDFTFKVAVIAFVAKQFGYISGPQILTSVSSSPRANKKRSAGQAESAPQNPFGDVFKGIIEQMAPMLQGGLKPQPQSKTPMSFSDATPEPEIEQSQTPTIPIADVE
jgi:hypothetical protein